MPPSPPEDPHDQPERILRRVCDVRLALKARDQTLVRQAMDGASLTRWEALVPPRVVEDIHFQGGMD
jgi:hypothetical protein